ncbi:META domain-containing protein [Niabella aquatica]
MKNYILIAAMLGTLAACNNNSNTKSGTTEDQTTEQKTEAITPASNSDLTGKEWKLLELNGKPVVLDTTFPKYPHVRFETENKVSGNLGCNTFGGNYKPSANNTLEISDINATMIACPNLQVEQAFLEVLKSTKAFSINNDTLDLNNEKQETIARLKAQ